MTTGVAISNLSKSYGAVEVLRDIDIDVAPGEFVVLLGQSGCGKSTLLRLVSGLEEEHEGTIRFGERDVTGLDPKDRGVAMVFQSYALYPHMTVFDNIAFGMQIRGEPKAHIAAEVARVADVLKLTDQLGKRPALLSGGQRQRVAIGRAMVRDPDVFLFDEPLSNLDAKLRGEMRAELKRIHKALGATILYVTHDQIEAMTLADTIVLLNEGTIEQMGSPTDIYMEPDTLFAARFIGAPEINVLPVRVRVEGDALVAELGNERLPLPARAARGDVVDGTEAMLAVRPEFLSLGAFAPSGQAAGAVVGVTRDLGVVLCEPTGSETFVELSLDGVPVRLKRPGLTPLRSDERVDVTWDLSNAHLFSAATGAHL